MLVAAEGGVNQQMDLQQLEQEDWVVEETEP
jgi:hypothetical protein